MDASVSSHVSVVLRPVSPLASPRDFENMLLPWLPPEAFWTNWPWVWSGQVDFWKLPNSSSMFKAKVKNHCSVLCCVLAVTLVSKLKKVLCLLNSIPSKYFNRRWNPLCARRWSATLFSAGFWEGRSSLLVAVRTLGTVVSGMVVPSPTCFCVV